MLAPGWAPVNISFVVEKNVEIIPTKMARLHFGHVVVAPVPVCVYISVSQKKFQHEKPF